jgi:hypothetical protein
MIFPMESLFSELFASVLIDATNEGSAVRQARRVVFLSQLNDDLALCPPGFDISHGLLGRFEWKDSIHHAVKPTSGMEAASSPSYGLPNLARQARNFLNVSSDSSNATMQSIKAFRYILSRSIRSLTTSESAVPKDERP